MSQNYRENKPYRDRVYKKQCKQKTLLLWKTFQATKVTQIVLLLYYYKKAKKKKL